MFVDCLLKKSQIKREFVKVAVTLDLLICFPIAVVDFLIYTILIYTKRS